MTCHIGLPLSRPNVVNAATAAGRVGQCVAVVAVAACWALSAQAATLPVWNGPGDHAPCRDRCRLADALDALPAAMRAEAVAAIRANPMGAALPVRDGDVLGFMTYAAAQGTGVDRRGFVAVIDAPEPARGWQLDGWRFVRVAGCANWVPVLGVVSGAMGSGGPISPAGPSGVSAAIASHGVPGHTFAPWPRANPRACRASGHTTGNGCATGPAGGQTPAPVPNGPVASVPLPAPIWMLAAGLAWLVAVRWLA